MIAMNENMMKLPLKDLCGGTGNATFTVPFARGTLPYNVVTVTLEPGASCGEHLHDKDTEIFFVLSGELVMIDDGEETVMHAGDCEYCTIGHTHGAVNRSDKPASYLAIGMP